MNKMKTIRFAILLAVLSVFVSCGTTSTVPLTGRKQRLLVSDEQVMSLSNKEYTTYMKSAKLSSSVANTAMVKKVGQRLADAVVLYLKNNGLASGQAIINGSSTLFKTMQPMLSACREVKLLYMKDCYLIRRQKQP